MSTVLIVTPILITQWPVIAAAVTAAVGSLGFTAVKEVEGACREQRVPQREEVEIDDCEILSEASGTHQQIVVERGGVRAVFNRDERGALKVCVEGGGLTKRQLRQLADDIIGRVRQQYAYHRIMSELQQRNVTIVDEQVGEDQSVKIRIRNW